MNLNRKLIIFIILIATELFAQPLSINISLEKNKYFIYEHITLMIEIKNDLETPVTFGFSFNSTNFKLLVFKDDEQVRQYRIETGTANYTLRTLEGGASMIYFDPLFPWACVNSKNEKNKLLQHLVEGKYSIELEYNFGEKLLNTSKKYIVKSNKLNFEVIKPINETYEKQLSMYKYLMNDFSLFDGELYEDKINEIIKLDSKSPYSLLAYNKFLTTLKYKGDVDKYKNIIGKVCNKYPNSYLPLMYAKYYEDILDEIIKNKELKGTSIKNISKKIKESKTKVKYLDKNIH